MTCHFIFYVRDQAASSRFYRGVLGIEPRLDVPGMTEFELKDGCVLGLMPETGIEKLLGSTIKDPGQGAGIPRAELYLLVDDPRPYILRAVSAGAKLLSELQARDWGHEAGYTQDLDGHIIAFARAIK